MSPLRRRMVEDTQISTGQRALPAVPLALPRMLAATRAARRLHFFGDRAGLADPAAFIASLRKADWVAYAKTPFGGPEAVPAYLSRYTHRVAIANARIGKLHQLGPPPIGVGGALDNVASDI